MLESQQRKTVICLTNKHSINLKACWKETQANVKILKNGESFHPSLPPKGGPAMDKTDSCWGWLMGRSCVSGQFSVIGLSPWIIIALCKCVGSECDSSAWLTLYCMPYIQDEAGQRLCSERREEKPGLGRRGNLPSSLNASGLVSSLA